MTKFSLEVDLEKLPSEKKDWENWVKEKISKFVKDENNVKIQNTTEKGTKMCLKWSKVILLILIEIISWLLLFALFVAYRVINTFLFWKDVKSFETWHKVNLKAYYKRTFKRAIRNGN